MSRAVVRDSRPRVGSPSPSWSPDILSTKEMEAVTTVFRNFETGLREASIDTKDLLAAMKMLGLNPMEQEIVDVTNEIARNGLIFFPEFCEVVLARFREEDEEEFRENMFKMFCGTDPHPAHFRAKKYKIQEHFLSKEDFTHIMKNLPEKVSEEDIECMFSCADQDQDGKISFSEFQVMINPPRSREAARPDIAELHSKTGPAGRSKSGVANGKEKKKPERRRSIAENPPVSSVPRTTEPKQQHNGTDTPQPEGSPLPLSLENIKLHDKMTSNLSLRK